MNRFTSMLLGAAMALGLAGGAAWAKDQFVVDLVNEPASLDPHVQWNPDSYFVYRNIFDNLVTRTNDGEIVPEIATSWEQVSDTQMVMQLRDDVVFHDGEKMTPEDVVYSIRRITDPAFASPQLGQFNKITGVEKTGENEITITTDGPYPVLLAQLVKLSVVPEHVVEKMGRDAFNLAPVGSGPYKFGEWKRGVSVELLRNDAYWGEKGPFASALFRAVPDAATRVADLRAGTADLIVSIDSDQAAQIRNASGIKVLSALTERVGFLGMNLNKPPFDNIEMRRALAYAIDRDGINEGILAGGEKNLGQMTSPAHFGYKEGIEPLPYDPEKAREIVKAHPEEAAATVTFGTAPPYDQRVVQAIQQMLTDVGFKVEIAMTDMATYLKLVQQDDETARPGLNFGRWSCACQDADGILFPLMHSKSSWSRINDDAMDKYLEEGRSSLDPAVRQAAYDKVHELNKEMIYLLPLHQAVALYGANARLEWTPTANESLFLNRMSWSE
jgi:peptide/nickel transport system substrate-binding protein